MINLSINEKQLERSIKRARELNIIVPTFAEHKDPALIPEAIKVRLREVGLWEIASLNLYDVGAAEYAAEAIYRLKKSSERFLIRNRRNEGSRA